MSALRIGVELAVPGDDPGGWLAEATAYEAAGVDSLWVGDGDGAWVLLGALAAVTWRVRLGVLPSGGTEPAAAADVLRRMSRGRLSVARRGTSGEVLEVEAGGAAERWSRAAPPPGRPAWAEALDGAAIAGAAGLLVPASPWLLDLLRNPHDEDDRSDLQLTYG
ncbi:MAG TPA: hypothetical protein VGP96_12655 [Candidatus Dormibacteraeota bacterium]|nr:hypothetical protein [Candidatus Dormibacteraeota bacterium]